PDSLAPGPAVCEQHGERSVLGPVGLDVEAQPVEGLHGRRVCLVRGPADRKCEVFDTPCHRYFSGAPRQARCSSAVATAARPSPRPVRPSPAVVVADRESTMPWVSVIACSASARRDPIFGRLPISWTATLDTSQPASRTRRRVSASRSVPAAPAHSGSAVPKLL